MNPPAPQSNLVRVSNKIAEHILEYFRRYPGTFHMQDLVRFVTAHVPETAPDSTSRILRDLRRKGKVGYKVISRSQSLYQLLPLKTPPPKRIK